MTSSQRPRAGRLGMEFFRGARCVSGDGATNSDQVDRLLRRRWQNSRGEAAWTYQRVEDNAFHLTRVSPRFRVRSLLNLFKSRIGILNPITRLVDLSRIHRNRARNRLGNLLSSSYHLSFILHWFRAFDRKLPVMSESVERVKHGLSFNSADPAAPHGEVEHTVAILPGALLVPVCDIVQHRGIPISSFERPAHNRPKITRNGCTIDNRSNRSDPRVAIRIYITQFGQQRHCSAVWIPLGDWLAIVITPFGAD